MAVASCTRKPYWFPAHCRGVGYTYSTASQLVCFLIRDSFSYLAIPGQTYRQHGKQAIPGTANMNAAGSSGPAGYCLTSPNSSVQKKQLYLSSDRTLVYSTVTISYKDLVGHWRHVKNASQNAISLDGSPRSLSCERSEHMTRHDGGESKNRTR